MKRLWYIVLIGLVLTACTVNPPQPDSLVLEGWIDADGYPVVLIHRSYVLANAPDSVRSLEEIVMDQLIPFGKVVVSDDEQEVILTGRLDTLYLPPYSYSSLNMVGQVGKTYTVTAKYKDLYATATTTIPPVAYIDSLVIKQTFKTRVSVTAYMSDVKPDEESYYALFLREYGTKQFVLCPFGVFDSQKAVDGKMELTVFNPLTDYRTIENVNSNFHRDTVPSDTIKEYQLKVARIDYPSYLFWKAYNEQVVTSGIVFVPVFKNMPSNVEGGIGYFSGMGSSVYRFNLQTDTTYVFLH